ncbi:MAG: flavoprotein [Pseudomonadota bacterium]|nr:flavoprotein [Pseudomonadota bacterium]
MNNKKKRIAWGITGSGHYLKESIEIIESLNNVDMFLSQAGEEVLKWYNYKLNDFKKSGVKIFKDVTASSAPVSLFYEDIYDVLIISPATSNTVAQMVYGFSDNLITNIFAQAGKCNIHSIVLACDTEPVVITPAPGKMVTVYPREIDLKNYELLKKFKNTDVVRNSNELKKIINKRK